MYLSDRIYHVYNQGNNRQKIFFANDDYYIFLSLYKRLIHPCASTIAWCLMPNHFHFMLKSDERSILKIKQGGLIIDSLTNGFRKLLSGYARIFNNRFSKTGSVFRQKTKSKCLSEIKVSKEPGFEIEDYYLNCFNYIHQNPVVANLVTRAEDWEFSSFRDYAGLRNGNLCQKELAKIYCGYDQENFINGSNMPVDKKILKYFT